MPPYSIRRGERADLGACIALVRLATPERSRTDWRDSLERDIGHPEHHLVVAEHEGEIAGYGRARLFEPGPNAPPDSVPRGYYLTGLFVHPEHRRGGIGTALVEARLDWIREHAVDAWFFSNARNTASIELHRRFGFEEVTRHFTFPGLTFEGGEGILFRLQLRSPDSRAPESFAHGSEPRAEEIALHQKFLTLQTQIEAAAFEGDEREVRRLRPLLERARKRWIAANMRVTRNL